MTSLSRAILQLQELNTHPFDTPKGHEVRVAFLPPALHIDLISDQFEGRTNEDRLASIELAMKTCYGDQTTLARVAISQLPIIFSPLTVLEARKKVEWMGAATSSSWVNWFLDTMPTTVRKETSSSPRYIHFYGYKGGQARSSILALFGKLLADDGYRVLAIDADTEAPSLDSLLGIYADKFSQTLMGLCGWSNDFEPLKAAYTGQMSDGRIDLLPCRPRGADFDLDFALLVATAPMDFRVYERAAAKLRTALLSLEDEYDFILLDHRTGIATSVLPLVGELPGPTAIFVRTDANTSSIPSEMRKVVRSIFGNAADNPGAFVSFSLDANKKSEAALQFNEARAREALLEELAFNWVDWYLDRALLGMTLPNVPQLQKDNIDALRKLRSVLGLPLQKNSVEKDQVNNLSTSTVTSLSGAKDEGTFIHIPEVERLFIKGSPFSYILGRKGTGKTRLLKELAERKLGTPILVAADQHGFSCLRSESLEATEWVKASSDPNSFWWSLIQLSLIENSTTISEISDAIANQRSPDAIADPLLVKKILLASSTQRIFLIDGLETLVPAGKIKAYVASLFSVMNTVQNDVQLSSKLVLRVFMREDLASDSVQNIEQQMEGRLLRLKWSATSILNFAVSRMPQLPWISQEFRVVCEDVHARGPEIEKSGLSEVEATEILLRIFPYKLRRNNLLTSTFLQLYFSDAGGDNTSMATFYPRLYLSFLQKLDALAQAENEPLTEDSRLNSTLLNRAYDQASTSFIDETKQELVHLLSLAFTTNLAEPSNDQSNVTLFISAFDGLSTPFALDRIVTQLRDKTPFTEQSIRESLRRMKALRMFEDRPGYAGWWRVGQLYKMGLRMKYAR